MSDNDYFKSEEFRTILNKYEESISMDSSCYFDADNLTDIAEYYHLQGQLPKSIKAIDYAISLFPGATTPLIFKARLELLKEGNIEKAEQYVDQIDDKSDLDYFYIKAELLIARHLPQEASSYLEQMSSQVDDEELEDYYVDVTTLFIDYDLIDIAEIWLKRCNDIDSVNYKELLGRILMTKGSYQNCEKVFNELIDNDPYSNTYWNQLASSQFLRNDIQNSITSSEFSIAINPNDEEALLNKANGLFALGNYERALEYYERFSHLNHDDETGELFLGITLLNLDKAEEAIEHLLIAEERMNPSSSNCVQLYQELAFAFSHIGRLTEALAYVDKADVIASKHDEMLVLRGHLSLENKQIKKAQEYYQEAINSSDYDPKIYLQISISFFDNNYISVAYKMFKTLLETVDDTWTDGYAYMSACCFNLKKREEFLINLKKAITINPSEAKMALGDLFPEGTDPKDYYEMALHF